MANLFRIPGPQMTVGPFFGADGAEVPASAPAGKLNPVPL
jgi:hypothetical protein